MRRPAASLQRTLILVTYRSAVTQGLAPAPSLFEALLRECRADWGPTLESRVGIDRVPRSLPPSLVPSPLLGVGRHSRTVFCLVWAGYSRSIMLCYVYGGRHGIIGELRSSSNAACELMRTHR